MKRFKDADLNKLKCSLQEIRHNDELSLETKLGLFLTSISRYHPEADVIFSNLEFIDPDLLRIPGNTYLISQYIMEHIEKQTSNSDELMIKYFGYAMPITAKNLNQVIDDVSKGIEINQYEVQENIEEDELSLDEIMV